MVFNAITVHCASLCLDVITQERFHSYSAREITDFKSEVRAQIVNRLDVEPSDTCSGISELIAEQLADEVIVLLLRCNQYQLFITADEILRMVQKRLVSVKERIYLNESCQWM